MGVKPLEKQLGASTSVWPFPDPGGAEAAPLLGMAFQARFLAHGIAGGACQRGGTRDAGRVGAEYSRC